MSNAMKGTIVTFINEKGGIGKTSCCFNIGWELAKQGYKILMIDFDGQRANLSFFCGVKKSESMLTMYDILQTGRNIKDAILNVKENIDIIPANVSVSDLSQSAKISRLKASLREIKDKYDFVFVDVNPTPNWSHMLSLSVSDYVVIPMLPDIASLEANKGVIESITEVQDTMNPNLKVLGILLNKYTNQTLLSREVLNTTEKMAASLGTVVFDGKIRQAVKMGECVMEHEGITDYDTYADVSKDIRLIAKEMLERIDK